MSTRAHRKPGQPRPAQPRLAMTSVAPVTRVGPRDSSRGRHWDEVLKDLVPVLVPLESTDPVFKEAADRRRALECADSRVRSVPRGIGSIGAHPRIEVAAHASVGRLSPALDQVGVVDSSGISR